MRCVISPEASGRFSSLPLSFACQALTILGIDAVNRSCYILPMSKKNAALRRRFEQLIAQGLNFQQIAEHLGVTRQRVWQLANDMGYRVERRIILETRIR